LSRFYDKLVAEREFSPNLLAAVERSSASYAGTARIFRREIRIDPIGYVRVAGLGEVSTLAEHRGRGLAKQLLQASIRTACAGSAGNGPVPAGAQIAKIPSLMMLSAGHDVHALY